MQISDFYYLPEILLYSRMSYPFAIFCAKLIRIKNTGLVLYLDKISPMWSSNAVSTCVVINGKKHRVSVKYFSWLQQQACFIGLNFKTNENKQYITYRSQNDTNISVLHICFHLYGNCLR